MTNFVVALVLNFEFFNRTIMVSKFPIVPTKHRIDATTAQIIVTVLGCSTIVIHLTIA